jgi:hypothetical protein
MAQPPPPPEADDPTQWSEGQALELWKYFGGVGAADKNTMVTVESLLLGFSATVMGYLVTQVLCFGPFSVTKPYQGIGLAMLGLLISGVAVRVALLYGGYSNWNWVMADAVARAQKHQTKWEKLLPEKASTVVTLEPHAGASWFFNKAMKWGRPCEPTKRLAPIFSLYAKLAIVAAAIHAVVVAVSACVLLS